MTPLAYSIVKENWLPKKRRRFLDHLELASNMYDIHCFDVSGVFELADDLGQKWHQASIDAGGRYTNWAIDKTFAFLPAPKTWIEWNDEDGGRVGIHLEECENLALCRVVVSNNQIFGTVEELALALKGNSQFELRINPSSKVPRAVQITLIYRIYAFLALINSPKIIGRTQHMPHRALERAAAKGFAGGKFPLHAWTEIKLQVSKPVHIDDGEPHEAHLTGKRALHFCRAHVRIQRGKLVYVTSHWRGDPSIGIKQSRYVVAP